MIPCKDDVPFFYNDDIETDEMIYDLDRYEWLEEIMQQDPELVMDKNNE